MDTLQSIKRKAKPSVMKFNITDLHSLRRKYIFKYIQRLQMMVRRAEDKVLTYKRRLKKVMKRHTCNYKENAIDESNQEATERDKVNVAEPLNTVPDGIDGPVSTSEIEDQAGIVNFIQDIKAACETHQLQSGFVYEPTSGLYYDYTSGYYYNAEQGLYYDGNTGYYYEYDEKLKKHIFHSQAYGDPEDARTTISKIESSTRDLAASVVPLPDDPSVEADSRRFKAKKTTESLDKRSGDNRLVAPPHRRHHRRGRRSSSASAMSEDDQEEYHRKDSRRKYRRRDESPRRRSRSRGDERSRRSRSRSKRLRRYSKDRRESRRRSRSWSDLEDGELSTNSGSSQSAQAVVKNQVILSEKALQYEDVASKYPPSLRVIVLETNLAKLRVGELFLITYKGGSLGREGDHDVIVPDINVSKFHLTFKYNATLAVYECVDMGSRNGTLLDGHRMSNAKQESEPLPVVHNSIIQLSQTKLLFHVHDGYATCDQCEPGLNVVAQPTGSGATEASGGGTSQLTHKQELKQIRKRYGLADDKYLIPKITMPNDRAAQRRLKVGSTNPNEKTEVASVDTNIAANNKGFQMLSKLGWTKGQKLGKNEQGILEPIPLVSNAGTQGLGSKTLTSAHSHSSHRSSNANALKAQQMRITQDRYNQSQPTGDNDGAVDDLV